MMNTIKELMEQLHNEEIVYISDILFNCTLPPNYTLTPLFMKDDSSIIIVLRYFSEVLGKISITSPLFNMHGNIDYIYIQHTDTLLVKRLIEDFLKSINELRSLAYKKAYKDGTC